MNLGQMLAQTAERLPNKTAIRFREQETTYADFDKRAIRISRRNRVTRRERRKLDAPAD